MGVGPDFETRGGIESRLRAGAGFGFCCLVRRDLGGSLNQGRLFESLFQGAVVFWGLKKGTQIERSIHLGSIRVYRARRTSSPLGLSILAFLQSCPFFVIISCYILPYSIV